MLYTCEKCGRKWKYPIEKCTFCKQKLVATESSNFIVRGKTEVFVPTVGNTKVPYFTLLLEDKDGNYSLMKSFKDYELGSQLKTQEDVSDSILIGVIGSGIMGTGIVQLIAESGFDAILVARTETSLNKSVSNIEKKLSKNYDIAEKDVILGRIKPSTDINLLSDVDIIIESVTEDINVKKNLLKQLNTILKPSSIIATNTSSLSISELAKSVTNPERFIGMHFFNPAYKMKLVEVVYDDITSKDTIDSTVNLAKMLGKTPIQVRNCPGFIVNRVLMPYLNEAIALLADNTADAKSIDTAITLGLNNPVGPLALADFIGLDICIAIMEILYSELKQDKFIPHPLLQKMVEQGDLGIKTGKGFYEYR